MEALSNWYASQASVSNRVTPPKQRVSGGGTYGAVRRHPLLCEQTTHPATAIISVSISRKCSHAPPHRLKNFTYRDALKRDSTSRDTKRGVKMITERKTWEENETSGHFANFVMNLQVAQKIEIFLTFRTYY